MNVNFQRYLASKYILDLNALHMYSLLRLYSYLEKNNQPSTILDIGGGIGSMFTYFIRDKIQFEFDYTIIDESKDNIRYIPKNLRNQLQEKGFTVEDSGDQKYRISNGESICQLQTVSSSVEDYVKTIENRKSFDFVIASSFLDIVPVPETLRMIKTFLEPNGILYLPFNYDGLTFFHPIIDKYLDEEIIAYYNQSMDNRKVGGLPTGGSQTGRKLLDWLPEEGYKIVSAGSSDWCLLPAEQIYRSDEGYFLECIIQFIEESVSPLWKDRPEILENWLRTRRQQIVEAKLSYFSHQLDFIAFRHE
jgi:SAM-dependent methyltransferase